MYIPELLKKYGEKYSGLEMRGLHVTGYLVDRVMAINPITLDGLLSWAVVQDAEYETGEKIPFSDRTDYPYIPLPLEELWLDERCGPLRCTSFFLSDGVSSDIEYFHKRVLRGERTKSKNPCTFGIKGVTGRWAERRTPFPVMLSDKIEAYCRGDLDEICRLLNYVTHVGKKVSAGFGLIERWEVETAEISAQDCLVRDGLFIRNIPCGYSPEIRSDEPAVLLGWAHPYWNPSFYGKGWRFGAEKSGA